MNEIRPPASLIDHEHFPRLETSQLPQDISIEISSALGTSGCVGLRWIQGSLQLQLFDRSVLHGTFGSCAEFDII
jgi:hypothetical protein